MKQIRPVSAFSLLRQARLDLFDLDVDIRQLSDAHENATCDLMMTATDEPARSFRQKNHADSEDQRRCDGQAEHPSPALDAGKRVIGQICNDDTYGDSKLKKRYNPATRMRRRDLGQIDRNIC